jgi:hypothetical protein
MRRFRIAVAAIMGLCLLPVLATVAAIMLASIGDCQLDEGSVHPCIIAGVDIGEALYSMGVSFWFALATLPNLVMAAVVWAAVEVWRIFTARSNRK